MDSKANSKGKDGKVNQTDHTGHSLQAEMPYPSVALLKGIKQFLIEKASGTVISLGKLHVTGPSYFRIFISANLYVTRIDDLPVAQKKALDLIKKFLDPLKGGKDGMGWEFQKILRISDIHSLFSDIPEVEYVDSVFVRIEIDKSNLMSVHRSDIDKPIDEHILSETNSDTDAITSKLLPHSLLYDGKAHNLTMKISSQK